MTNSGKLYIYGGANLSSFVNFENTSSGELLNNGNLFAKGNIRNDQSLMLSGTGTLYLNGNIAQQVNGAASMNTYDLITNNSAGITLNNDLSVAGVHTFTNGMITSASNYLIYQAGSSYAGANDSKHVNGWVKKFGSTDFIFPVGNASFLRTISITNLSASSGFNAHYYLNTSNIFNLWSPLVQVHANEYWQLDKISGGTAQVTMNWDHSKIPMDNVLLSDVLTSQYFSSNWHSGGGTASGAVTGTGTIQSNVMSSFGPMTFGYKSFPVPLKLVSFDGERRDTINLLHWVSENEYNVDRFEIQRSTDAVNYTTIGNVAGRNRNERAYYQYADPFTAGTVYYRLRMIDIDGTYTFSRIIVIASAVDGSGLLVKNPAKNVITIYNRSKIAGPFNYTLFNENGQVVLKGIVTMPVNSAASIDLPAQINTGAYYLELSNTQIKTTRKIIISRS